MTLLRDLYIHARFYSILIGAVVLFILGVFNDVFFFSGIFLLFLLVILSSIDLWMLFMSPKGGVDADREVAEHLSNGDSNSIGITIENHFQFPCKLTVIDELPVQFQARDLNWKVMLSPGQRHRFKYTVRPVTRGEYAFGAIHVYARSPLGLMMRRFSFSSEQTVKVYPSYLQLRKFAFLAFDNRLQLPGLKRMRKIGHTSEFEQIKEYIAGDDTRTLNWKATARTGRVMVNQYRDERAQPVYCLLDKGRLMQMPFDGLTLLDHAINTTLVMSYVAIRKEDQAGILTFADRVHDLVRAGRRNNQMYRISEALYKQKTDFPEADFEHLYAAVNRYLTHRSLLLLFTNFESLSGLKRQLPYLRKIAEKHMLITIFFQNTELKSLIEKPAKSLREIYHQTIAEKFQNEKEGMLVLLRQWGLGGVLTTPENLTVDTINKYLELKARGLA